MNKKYIISRNEEIASIVKTGKKRNNNIFNIYYEKNTYDISRYCISVSKKIGNAVLRNRCKRIVKEILRKINVNKPFNYVIIIRKAFLVLSFKEIEAQLKELMEEIN